MQAVSTNGARIRELRRSLGLTQEQLGRACGLPATVVSHVENNNRDLSLERQFRVAHRLGVPVEDITTIVDVPETTEVSA